MDDKTNDTQSGIQGINLLVIPSKKWLLDRNLNQQGFFQGFSDNTQGTEWVRSHWLYLRDFTGTILRTKQAI